MNPTAVLSQNLRAAIRANHLADAESFCTGCWEDLNGPIAWPCTRVLLLDALEAAEQEAAWWKGMAERILEAGEAERDALQAKIDAALAIFADSTFNELPRHRLTRIAAALADPPKAANA